MSSSKFRIQGKAVNLIQLNLKTRKYELNIRPIEEILLSPETKDCEVCIISVAGALRGGKSFLLSYFIRYLHSATVLNVTEHWMGDPDEKLTGFEWKKGSQRQTTGILIWSEIFYYRIDNKKIAIILMDTQGTFDTESTLKDNITIFAFSSMIASVQLFNISKRIQENYLNDLQLFTEYGKYILNTTNYKPFQSLMFLIRDWSNNDEYKYGEKGGLEYMNKTLNIDTNQHKELTKIRYHIRSCYEDLKCFLLPHPVSDEIDEDDYYFEGKIKDLHNDFKVSLKELANSVLSKQNVVVKTVNGKRLKAHELVYFIKSYWKIFQNDEMPTPKTILAAAAEATCNAASKTAIKYYEEQMGTLITETNKHIRADVVMESHRIYLWRSVNKFYENAILGSDDLKKTFKNKIISDIGNSLETYLDINKKKAVQKKMQQLQRNVENAKAKGHQHNEMITHWYNEVTGLLERVKTKCGRSFECQAPYDCTFGKFREDYDCYMHKCSLHYCPGPLHSSDCIQYQQYNQCYSNLRQMNRCSRCGKKIKN